MISSTLLVGLHLRRFTSAISLNRDLKTSTAQSQSPLNPRHKSSQEFTASTPEPCTVALLSNEFVSSAMDGDDVTRVAGVIFDFVTELGDVHVNGAR